MDWRLQYSDKCFENVTLILPELFKTYLLGDGIYTGKALPSSLIEWSDGDDGSEVTPVTPSAFPEFHKSLSSVLKVFGSCLPKVGNSTPKDAVWINAENSLRCDTVEEIYELLKASDQATIALRNGSNTITLIRWMQLNHSLEFRCFVKEGRFVAICQRDDTVFYSHLRAMMETLQPKIAKFIDSLFARNSCVMDLYYVQDQDQFIIVDVETWDEKNVNPILFTWDELNSNPSASVLVRLIESESECRLGYLRYNNHPVDL